ncbi:MAG: helix-turn-helix transcriptional regulator [Chloroflexi bacterium]|nr:helix-turn-helix transcriptional regulator [Chloroflexota bacterium]
MSLGDYLRLLRAKRGGITPWEIEAATGLTKGLYRQMEQRYRAVGDAEAIRMLADFYGVPFEELDWRLNWPRKALSRMLVAARDAQVPITLHLWNGEAVTGQVRWWDLGAAALETPDAGLVVVQRHAVEQWTPAAPEDDSRS